MEPLPADGNLKVIDGSGGCRAHWNQSTSLPQALHQLRSLYAKL